MKKKSPLFIIFIIVFIDLVGFGIIIPLSPYLSTHFGASAFEVGLLMTIYSLMQFLFAPFWGRISDKLGRRPILLISLLGATLSHTMFAFAQDLTWLFIARGLAGFFGANISTAMAYIADVTTDKDRSKGMGLIGAAFGLGFVLGPFLGGILSDIGLQYGTKPPFGMGFSALGAALICLIDLILAFFLLDESLPPEKRSQKKFKSRLNLFKEHIGRPVLGSLIFMAFLGTFAFAHMEATMALLLKDKWLWNLTTTSYGFAYIGIIMVFTQGYLIRKITPKYGEPRVLLLGLVLAAVGLVGIGFTETIPVLAVNITLMGIGIGLFNPSNFGSISLITSSTEQGEVMGLAHSFSAMGRILGPASGGYLYGKLGQPFPFWTAGIFMAAGFVWLFTMRRKLPQSQGEAVEKINTEKPYLEISEFQFQNILINRVPCMHLDLRLEPQNPTYARAMHLEISAVNKYVEDNSQTLDQPIILVCEDGSRSIEVALVLSKKGYKNVTVLVGGVNSLGEKCKLQMAL